MDHWVIWVNNDHPVAMLLCTSNKEMADDCSAFVGKVVPYQLINNNCPEYKEITYLFSQITNINN